MPCWTPLQAYKPPKDFWTKQYQFAPIKGHDIEPSSLPCGKCSGCRTQSSRNWAIRCVHENQMHDYSCFVTLTFNDDYLARFNPLGTLIHRDFQLFMKRLRTFLSTKKSREFCDFGILRRVRFYHCGEYGAKHNRPHHHALLFGVSFKDLSYLRTTESGERLYRSPTLETLWDSGYSSVGTVTFKSAAYVARYIMKKQTSVSDGIDKYFRGIDEETGEFILAKPEYNTMSRRPGIAKSWFDLYKDDVYPSDKVVMRNMQMRPPRYYDNLYKEVSPFEFEDIQFTRYENSRLYVGENTPERLLDRRKVAEARLNLLRRTL